MDHHVPLHDDFFAACDGADEPRPDRAFEWTAQEDGLHHFTVTADSWDVPTGELAVRRGGCEGLDAHPDDTICAPIHCGEDTCFPTQVLALTAGETVTLIVEGASHVLEDETGEIRSASYHLRVDRQACPGTEVWLDAPRAFEYREELPSEAPLDAEVLLRVADPFVRQTSCEAGVESKQSLIAWTAPESGRYRFVASEQEERPTSEVVILALLADDCAGEELACQGDPIEAAVTRQMEAGETVVVLLETEAVLDEDVGVHLHIAREE